jgi:hypothetical protein
MFLLYGVGTAVLSETIAKYQYHCATAGDLSNLSEADTKFVVSLVLLVGMMGAGLALTSGVLFYLGLFKQIRETVICAILGGAMGLAVLITIHLDQRAWILFIIDNVCLNVIGIGFGVGGKDFINFLKTGVMEDA